MPKIVALLKLLQSKYFKYCLEFDSVLTIELKLFIGKARSSQKKCFIIISNKNPVSKICRLLLNCFEFNEDYKVCKIRSQIFMYSLPFFNLAVRLAFVPPTSHLSVLKRKDRLQTVYLDIHSVNSASLVLVLDCP